MATSGSLRKARNPKTRFNWRVSDLIRQVTSWWLELRARVTGEKYYCNALAGEADYDITINSDLTVSCNCQDYEGTGHFGDLRKQTFEEAFFGPVAQKFRDDLAKGKIPIPTCVRCGSFRRLKKNEAPPKPRLPYRGMLLENTVRCNVDCVGCAREEAAKIRVNKQLQMPLNELSQMADVTARLKMERIYYLNLGEPFLSPAIGQELPILRAKNPDAYIRVSTNGVLLNTDAKREAKAMVEFRNARGLKEPTLEWKYLLFNWNDHPRHIAKAIEMAKAIGVDIISFWPTNNPFYGISWRYRLGGFKNVGVACWKGREVDFRQKPIEASK
jgi:hypothetical protein